MNRDTFTVKVDNISQHIQIREVESLFNSLVGEVQHSAVRQNGANARYLELSFYTHDNYKKALCMSGYNVGGSPLVVTRACMPNLSPSSASKGSDGRRNLYVLGLPFDLTKAEFTGIFSRFGTVSHAVILATVDNASRRRGFVVMESHEEAKAAMNGLSRTQIKGHMLDVSWAVVQRSQGFLDGADRTMMLSSPTPPSLPGVDICLRNTSDFAAPNERNAIQWPPTMVPSSKLLVSNLPTLLFTQASDLHPLLYPFGPIKELKMLEPSSTETQAGTTSASVEYASPSSAREAKEALQGQLYADFPMDVQYVQDNFYTAGDGFVSGPGRSSSGYGKISDTRLNPFAPPFILGSHMKLLSSGFAGQVNDQHAGLLYNAMPPRGLPCDARHPLSPQPLSSHIRRPVFDAISRSSSATSSNWSNDVRPSGRRVHRTFA
ncbi:hypothetical protein BV22DRAFT_1036301 [Leucogyrophana mollusca]|uniref:Uncharacterized protein n=1 Tax=Leucogyrophana mollusca TaxID=85980 RepID=A0ACB8BDV1_9AGAM|nr:hypothetical protein BV22DRAFT_1036301 [Leucogyrophana mollusca]